MYHIYYKGHCPILNQTHMSCSPTQAPEEEQKEEQPKHRKFKKARGRAFVGLWPNDELCLMFGYQLKSRVMAYRCGLDEFNNFIRAPLSGVSF